MIDYFRIEELIPRDVFNLRGDKAWQLLDWRALKTLEWLREHLGSCTVNDWLWGGSYSQSGLRTHAIYLQGAMLTTDAAKIKMNDSYSQHKYGRAFDCKFKHYTAEAARQYVKDHWADEGLPWSITLENDVGWLHFDVRTREDNLVHTFNP